MSGLDFCSTQKFVMLLGNLVPTKEFKVKNKDSGSNLHQNPN